MTATTATTATMASRIGMIGIGLMGKGIARNLMKAGYALNFLHHEGNQPVDDLLALGARACERPAEVAEGASAVLLCVTGAAQVESVLCAKGGLLEGLAPGTVIIDCSTSLPETTRRLAHRVAAAGGEFADAAMTRTPREAAEGRLNLIVGATPDLFRRISPLLACFSEATTHAGEVGSGHTLKLVHNYVSLGFAAVLAEASAMSRRAGIDDAVLLEVLDGGGGRGAVLERLTPYLDAGDASGFRFSLANAIKDIAYYRTLTDQLGSDSALAASIQALYASAPDASLLIPEIIPFLEGRRDAATT